MNAQILRFTIIPLFGLLLLVAQPFVYAETGALDGKTFVAELAEKGKSAHEKADVISFKDGKFHSSSCDKYGYNQGAYTAVAAGDSTTFDVETVSESDGKLQWHGVVKGSEIEGKFTHYPKPGFFRRNPAPVENTFKGTLK
ncbi:MAG: hypothetical protein WCC58_03650 [Burkholderiales bacterium]